MKLVEINWHPTKRQLRQFGIIALFALPIIGWLWSGGNLTVVSALGGAGAVLAILGVVYPRALSPLFILLSLIAIPIGLVVGEVLLALIYFIVFLPIGTVFRLIGRDRLKLKIDRNSMSYWNPKKQPSGPANYFRQS